MLFGGHFKVGEI